jgi:hypothetical protein
MRVALTAVSTEAWPLMRITGTSGARSLSRARKSSPSISGITTPESTASTGSSASRSSARAPDGSVRAMLSVASVAYAHIRNTEAGCFIARIERA